MCHDITQYTTIKQKNDVTFQAVSKDNMHLYISLPLISKNQKPTTAVPLSHYNLFTFTCMSEM
jgi:hypothetical protein